MAFPVVPVEVSFQFLFKLCERDDEGTHCHELLRRHVPMLDDGMSPGIFVISIDVEKGALGLIGTLLCDFRHWPFELVELRWIDVDIDDDCNHSGKLCLLHNDLRIVQAGDSGVFCR